MRASRHRRPPGGREPALLRKALTLAGFAVEATTPIPRDHAGPAISRSSLPPTVRARHALGRLGRSAAVRARAPRA